VSVFLTSFRLKHHTIVIPVKTQYTIVIPAKAGIQVNVYSLLIPSCPGFYFGAGLNMPTKIHHAFPCPVVFPNGCK